MFTLVSGHGAQDYEVGDQAFNAGQWGTFRHAAIRMLRARGQEDAADVLAGYPFELRRGMNFFGDEFVVLFAELDLERYTACVEEYADAEARLPFRQARATLEEVCPDHARFVAVAARLDDATESVVEPDLRITSRVVTEALNDARYLVEGRGSSSGVDRAHTMFHGYLRAVCEDAGIEAPADADVTRLFRLLRDQHPHLQASGPRSEDISRALRALANIVDTLNPIRNLASLAHPNEELLPEPEANLVLNAIRTILQYLDQRLA